MELTDKQKGLVEDLEKSWDRGYTNVVWMMRSGKTLPVCEWLATQTGDHRVLVVCPPAVVPVWHDHWKITKRRGSPEINILSSGQLSQKTNGDYSVKGICGNDWSIVVVDELHDYRHYSGRLLALRYLSKNSKYRIGMTGTPYDQNLSELYYPLTWLSAGTIFGDNISKQTFRETYCYPTKPHLGKMSPWEVRPSLVDEFTQLVKSVSSVWMHPEVAPPKQEVVRYPLSKRQKGMVGLLGNGSVSYFLSEWGVDLAGCKHAHFRDKMRQVYGGFILDESSKPHRVCSTLKWWHMMQILNKTGTRRVVIWYRYLYEAAGIKQLLKSVFGVVVKGYSQTHLEEFRRDEVDILLCHPKSAGAGIDISHAEAAIFVTLTPNWTALMQAFYRLADRSGDVKTIYHMVADCKYDQKSLDSMRQKEQRTLEFYR